MDDSPKRWCNICGLSVPAGAPVLSTVRGPQHASCALHGGLSGMAVAHGHRLSADRWECAREIVDSRAGTVDDAVRVVALLQKLMRVE